MGSEPVTQSPRFFIFTEPLMTVYERLTIFCKEHQRPLLSPKERSHLGEVIASYIPGALGKVQSLENGYWIPVNDYDEKDYPTIDFIIQKHYE